MVMKVYEADLGGVFVIEPDVFEDERGCFLETFHSDRYLASGIASTFCQDNLSISKAGVIRGLHFQNPNAQAKLIYVTLGEVFDVVVDVRWGSPTFGQWTSVYLSGKNKRQLYIPEGFAHGFCVTSDTATLAYKCSDLYHPGSELSVLWNDADIAIDWPVADPVVSEKDLAAPRLKDLDQDRLPVYAPLTQ